MKIVQSLTDPLLVSALKRGGVAVLRTDTIYGIVAQADDETAVQKVYELKQRTPTKSPIVLISQRSQLYDQPEAAVKAVLNRVWPGKTSVIIPAKQAPVWLRRANSSVAYRLPDMVELQDLIGQTGPLIAPSANVEGEAPATTIKEAITYFGDGIDVYVDGGPVTQATPSKLIWVTELGQTEVLR